MGQSVCDRCRNRPRPQTQIEEYVRSREKLQGKEAEVKSRHRERSHRLRFSRSPLSGFYARRVIFRDVTVTPSEFFVHATAEGKNVFAFPIGERDASISGYFAKKSQDLQIYEPLRFVFTSYSCNARKNNCLDDKKVHFILHRTT